MELHSKCLPRTYITCIKLQVAPIRVQQLCVIRDCFAMCNFRTLLSSWVSYFFVIGILSARIPHHEAQATYLRKAKYFRVPYEGPRYRRFPYLWPPQIPVVRRSLDT